MKPSIQIHIVGATGSGKTILRRLFADALVKAREGTGLHGLSSPLVNRIIDGGVEFFESTPSPNPPKKYKLAPNAPQAKHWPLTFAEAVKAGLLIEVAPLSMQREDGLQDDGKPLEVMPNPTDRKGALPWVRFAPGNGWSIYDTKHKGCHCPKLADAVADWNRYIDRTLAGLNIELVKASRHRVLDLPGWGDAVKQERVDRIARKAIAEGEEAARKVREERNDRLLASMGLPKALTGSPDAFTSEGPIDFKTSPKPKRSVIPALLSLAAAFGGLSEIMGAIDEPEGGPIDVFNPEMVRILKEAGLLHPSLDGPDSAIVAIPRMIGAENIERLENAIREGDVDAVKFLIVELNL